MIRVLLVASCLIPAPLWAQSMRLVGLVVDSATALPLVGAEIDIESPRGPALTGDDGMFEMEGVGPGEYTVAVRALGYDPLGFRLTVMPDSTGELDLGVIGLTRGTPVTVRLFGSVRDIYTDEIVTGANIEVDGLFAAVSDPMGSYEVGRLVMEPGEHFLRVRRIGYEDATYRLVAVQNGPMQFDINLRPSAVGLEEVVVEADAPRPRGKLAAFFRRREEEFGRFLGPDEIAQLRTSSRQASDILARIPGVQTQPSLDGVIVKLARCEFPTYFIDGAYVNLRYVDRLLQMEDIDAVEVYSGISRIPLEFVRLQRARGQPGEENCGVIVIWTRTR